MSLRSPRSITADSPANRRAGPAGHTLVEILLALGLSLVILVAVYGALDQHWRYAEAGQRQTERMQVTRALFEQISLDLRSVVFRSSAALDDVVWPSDGTRAGGLGANRSAGIVGDAATLMVQIDTPPADRSGGDQSGGEQSGGEQSGGERSGGERSGGERSGGERSGGERSSGERSSGERSGGSRTVRWEMLGLSTPPRGHAVAVSQEAASREKGAPAPGSGLARIVRAASPQASSHGVAGPAAQDVLAAEVASIRFRYFSRGSWFDAWDSVERQELPQAVEISIDFRRATPAARSAPDPSSADTYRLVVPVPVSEA